MLQQLQLIGSKLEATRHDVWLVEMLYRFLYGDPIVDPETEAYLTGLTEPRAMFRRMLRALYTEAKQS